MNYKHWFLFREFCSLVLFFLVLETVMSVDDKYEACVVKSCGEGPNISYPFWIDGEQESFCGYPGFQLSCKNREPVILMSTDEYIIRDILYDNQSFFITKTGTPDICSPQSYRIAFSHLPMIFAQTGVNLHLFFNCTRSLSIEYSSYSFGCGTNNLRNQSLALFSDNPALNNVNQSGECKSTVVIHVENGNLGSSTIRDFIDELLTSKGFHLNWTASVCGECKQSGGRCGFDYDRYKFMCFCREYPHHRRCDNTPVKDANMGLKVGIGARTAGIGVLLLTIVFFLCWKWHSSTNYVIFWKRKNKSQRLVEEFFKSYGSLAPKRYNYHDIKKITGSFKEKIGEGGYGCVYKGKLVDSRVVAVKLLNKAKGDGQEFINEVASISRTSHVNVVSLLGFCFNGSKRALIYEFMANGSLEKFIFDRNPVESQFHLGWESLYKIAVGVARGIEYLHRGCNTRILHFDIKPHNILLDQHFLPKISDFGLAKLCLRNESVISMLDTRGTAGYVAPEVFDKNFGGVSHKSDVYSYGKMVLEIVGRRKNIDVGVDRTSEIYFPHWIYKRLEIDEGLGLQGVVSIEEEQLVRKMILVAWWCIQTNPTNRPAMTKVVEMLEGGVELLHIPPQPNC